MAAFENVSKLTLRPHDRESFIDIRTTRLPSVLSLSNDFDPRQHREPKAPIKVWMAYFNLIRTGLGAGVLGVPLAISQAGIVLGPILAIFTGLLIIHVHQMLIWIPHCIIAWSVIIPWHRKTGAVSLQQIVQRYKVRECLMYCEKDE